MANDAPPVPGPAIRLSVDPLRWGHAGLAIAFALPLLLALQSILPGPLATIAVYGRLLVGPLLVAILAPRLQVWTALLTLCAVLLLTGIPAMSTRLESFGVLACSIVGALIMFRFGGWMGPLAPSIPIWRALTLGVTTTNLVSLLTFAALMQGWIDPVAFLAAINKEDPIDHGLTRFSFGNAIELPFAMTILLYAGLVNGRYPRGAPMHAATNLIMALISQSRVVLLMAALIFLHEWLRSEVHHKISVLAAFVAGLLFFWAEATNLLDSILSRLSGDDYGSADDRKQLVRHVLAAFDLRHILFGDGLTGAAAMLQRTIGEYRSVEAIALQLPLEVGIIGIGLLGLGAFGMNSSQSVRPRTTGPVTILAWIQFLGFLPVTTLSPVLAFALGAISITVVVRSSPELLEVQR